MLHHPGYFLIYDKKFRYCIFDGIYLKFENVARSARDRQMSEVNYTSRITKEKRIRNELWRMRTALGSCTEYHGMTRNVCTQWTRQ